MFEPFPELNELPADAFACLIRTARDVDANKQMLEEAVLEYLGAHVTDSGKPSLQVDGFTEIIASPGRMPVASRRNY